MNKAPPDQRGSCRVKDAQALEQGVDDAEGAPLPVASDAAQDRLGEAMSAPALRQVEAEQDGSREGEPDGDDADDGLVAPKRDKHGKADQREDQLRAGLNHEVDDDARAGGGAADPEKREE